MDFHLIGIAIGIIFLIFQLVFYKKIKNKVIRLIPLFIGFICLFFCFLLYLGYPPIETTFYSSNEFTGTLAMVWCGCGIFSALLGIFFANARKIFLKFKIIEKLKKLKNINSVNRNLIIIIVILIIIESIAFKQYFGNINPYISELNIVYTPNKSAYKFHYWHWIDVYEYYVFRLSDKEEKIIIQEAVNGNWSEMTLNHIDRIDSMEYGEFLAGMKKTFRAHENEPHPIVKAKVIEFIADNAAIEVNPKDWFGFNFFGTGRTLHTAYHLLGLSNRKPL